MDPIVGQPQLPGWYWVVPRAVGTPLVCLVEWNSPEGNATLIPQLHVVGGFIPTTPTQYNAPDVWYGPLDPPAIPDQNMSETQPSV